MISAVITTCKRAPDMVLRAVNSILAQTYHNIEIIVIDDSPDDYMYRSKVRSVIEKCAEENTDIGIYYIPHKRNMGACAARNTGMNHAKGEYIAYLDDDDEWLPEKLEKQFSKIQETKAALVYCGYYCKNEGTSKLIERNTEYHRGRVFKELLYQNFVGSTSFPLINLACLKSIGGFDIQMQSAQDADAWLRISKTYEIECVEEPLIIYHEHGGEQITNNPVKRINGLERLNQKYEKYINADPVLWWRRHIFITPYYAANGEMKKARTIWWRCVKTCPTKIKENLQYLRAIEREKHKIR